MSTVATGCELKAERGPDWLRLKILGIHSGETEGVPLAEEVWALVERHMVHRLVLELDEVRMLDSHLIGELIVLHRRMSERGGLMRLCGLSPYNRCILHRCRLDDRFLAYETWEEAVLGCQRPRQPR